MIAIRSTAIGVFESRTNAEQAVRDLLAAEFQSKQIGIVYPDAVAPAAGSGDAESPEVWVGAMFRSLVGVEIPESEVIYYEEAIQDGSVLVMVRAADRYPEAMNILNRGGGEYMAAF